MSKILSIDVYFWSLKWWTITLFMILKKLQKYWLSGNQIPINKIFGLYWEFIKTPHIQYFYTVLSNTKTKLSLLSNCTTIILGLLNYVCYWNTKPKNYFSGNYINGFHWGGLFLTSYYWPIFWVSIPLIIVFNSGKIFLPVFGDNQLIDAIC